MTVIDIGCGSGILSIAALKLGARSVLGVDIDAESIKSSRENAQLNGVGEQLILGLGSVAEIRGGQFPIRSAPLVMANILAPVLVRLFEAGLAGLVESGGSAILAGILDPQAASVIEAGRRQGMELAGQRQSADWVALLMSK